jgi:PAS domain S-box-containing protein
MESRLNHTADGVRSFDDYRVLAEAIPQLVWATTPSGAVDYWNRAWYEYTGLQPGAGMDDAWLAAVHPEDLRRTVERWQRSVTCGDPYDTEYRLRRHDGAYRWFVARGQAVAGPGGDVVRWYGTCTDVDALKVAEAAVRESAALFRKLANSLPQIVWTANAAGENTYLNHRWFDYTGFPRSAGYDLIAVAHPDDVPQTIEKWTHALATGTIFETEYRLKRADGVYRWFLGRAVPVRASDDTITEWFGSCTDIHDQKRAEAEMRTAYEREHRIATTLQRAFLTHHMPEIAGLRFDAIYRPADNESEVGGDWYDAIELDDGRIVISIGDVAGHGLDAAVVMGNVRQAIRVVAQVVDQDPVAMLDAVDRSLRRESPDKIVTAFIGIIDGRAGTLAYATAGHPPPFLYADGVVHEVLARGLPLGLRDTPYGAGETIALPATGRLVLYTDGLIESTRDVFEGERRLRQALIDADRDEPENLAQYVQERVLVEGARDDVAVLAVTMCASAAPRSALREQVA